MLCRRACFFSSPANGRRALAQRVCRALFAIHPLRVESVAWIAERKDVLSGFSSCSRWSLCALFPCPIGRALRLGLNLVRLGLMAKPMLVTMPFLLLLLDYWPLHRFEKHQRAQCFASASRENPAAGTRRRLGCRDMLAQHDALSKGEKVPLSWRISNALVSYCSYIGKMFWPTNLGLFYPFPQNLFPWWQVLLAFVFFC